MDDLTDDSEFLIPTANRSGRIKGFDGAARSMHKKSDSLNRHRSAPMVFQLFLLLPLPIGETLLFVKRMKEFVH